jgi:hypothetical protein
MKVARQNAVVRAVEEGRVDRRNDRGITAIRKAIPQV